MKKTFALALAVLAVVVDPPKASADRVRTVLLDDTFVGGERSTQAPPASIALFKAASTTTASVSPGAAQFVWTETSRDLVVGYFTPAGAPVALRVGDTLTVRVTFALEGLNPTVSVATPEPQLRFGVFDSRGTRVAADDLGTSRAADADDTGYALFAPVSTAVQPAPAFDLRRRALLGSTELFAGAPDFARVGAGGTARAFTDGPDYTLVYSIHRASPTQTALSATIVGGGLGEAYAWSAAETDASPATTFDSFAWEAAGSSFADAVVFKRIQVEVEAAADAPGDAVTATSAAESASATAGATLQAGVSSGPTITTPPTSQSVAVGSSAGFSVVATGNGPLAYQWQKDGGAIPGATADALSFDSAQLGDAGVYVVTVSDADGAVTSPPAALSVTNAAPLSVVNDIFADGDRTAFAPPGSVAWFKAQSSTAVSVVPGAATFTWATTSADMLFAYFTAAGSPVSLGVGDTLTLRLTFAFTTLNPASPQLRFGVLDSKGTRVSADNAGTSNANYAGDTGYGLFTPFSAAGGGTAFNLLRRTTTSSTNVFNTAADFTTIGSGGTAAAFASGTDYVLRYSVQRLSATQTLLSASITGGSLGTSYAFATTETSSSPLASFDYFGWRVGSSNFAAAITFKGLSVERGLVPPSFSQQPTSQSLVDGDPLTLVAQSTGSAPLTLQWTKDGVPLPGATSATLSIPSARPSDAGDYALTASNPVGSVTSDVAHVSVALRSPTIVQQPASQTILVGDTFAADVVANGTVPLSYQWQKGGIDIPGATGSSFVIGGVQLEDTGDYTVVVSNAVGAVLSDVAALVVTTTPVAPTVTQQPASQTVIAGSAAAFSVRVFGSTPLAYQWSKDGVPIAGANATSFLIPIATPADAAAYTVTVTNAAGTTTSNPAVLIVIVPPAILMAPASQTVNAGSPATFEVGATGTAPLAYQWRKDGIAISGATAATLSIGAARASDAGVYTVVVANAGGSITSSPATLTVLDPALTVSALSPVDAAPAACSDVQLAITFAVAPRIGSGVVRIFDAATNAVVDSVDVGLSPQTKTIGGTAYNYLPVIVSGTTARITLHTTLTYGRTYYVTVPTGAFATPNGVFAGLLGDSAWRFSTRPAGPDPGAASLVVSQDGTGDFCSVQGAIDFVPSGNGVRRLITLRNGTYQELVRITRPLVTLRGEDRHQTVIAYANNANFNPSVRGVVMAEASDLTLENLTVRNLTPKGGSQAEAVRMNGAHAILREVDLYSFQDTLQLNNTAFVENTYIEGDVDFMWGTASAYFVNSELRAVNPGYYVQARNVQGKNGFVYVNSRLSGASGLTGVWLARIDPNVFPFSQVVYIRSAMGPHINPLGWLLNNATTSDTVQFWEYRSSDLEGDPLDVSQRAPFSRQLSEAEAAQWSDPTFVLGGWVPEMLPIVHTPPASQTVSAGQDVVLSVGAAGKPEPTYQWLKDGVAIPGATGATLLLPAAQAGDAAGYTVVVSNSAGSVSSGPATLTVVADAGSPAIIVPPASTAVAIGDIASFAVSASGSAPLAYQWSKDGVAIAGANGPTLGVPAVQLSSAGLYGVTVSNGIGSVTSRPAVLSVHATPIETAPVVLTQPLSQTAIVGDPVSFTVVGRGVPTPAYQWLKDGQPIAGANAPTLMLSDVQVSEAGVYSVVLTNPLGTASSTGARLTVLRRGHIAGLTARGLLDARGELMALHFVIEGTVPKPVLLRAAGPALRSQGVIAALPNPRLVVRQGTTVVASNDNWGTTPGDIAGISAVVGALPFAAGSRDAAVLVTLLPGEYSLEAAGGVGVVQVEAYEVPGQGEGSKLLSNHTLGLVLRPLLGLDGELVVGGDTPALLLLRALGPALPRTTAIPPLRDPALTVESGSQVIASNDDWGSSPDKALLQDLFARAGASALPDGSRDAALAVTLVPGRYHVRVSAGHFLETGVAQLEAYEIAGLTLVRQPQSRVANVGSTVTLTVEALGAGPLQYQWRKNGVDVAGATASSLVLANVQPTDAGQYSVHVSNPTDEVDSSVAIVSLTSPTTQLPPLRTFDLEGFAGLGQGTTGGGLVDPTDSERYKVIDESTPNPAQTLRGYLEGPDPLVIELHSDVDLGALNNQTKLPLINPELIASHLGVIRIASNKTLFSPTGATLRHGSLIIDGSSNVILRNLKLRGLWEWDDATQGQYDLQGWDFVSITNGAHNVWVDHCDVGKAYDGSLDVVRGSDLVTVSWARFGGDFEGEVARQIQYLEDLYQANPTDPRISYYRALRDGGQSMQDILRHEIPQDKGNLVGNDDGLGALDTGKLNVTFHHDAYRLVRQRMPRMRFGNAHVYNLFADDEASAPFPGTQTGVNSTTSAAVLVENAFFLEVKTPFAFSNGGRISQRGSSWQLGGVPVPIDPTHLNPVDPAALVWNPPSGFSWPDLTRLPYSYTVDSADYTRTHLDTVGVIAPADAGDEALLRSYLTATRH